VLTARTPPQQQQRQCYSIQSKIRDLKKIKLNSNATHLCKASIAEHGSESPAHKLYYRRFTHRYPTSVGIAIAYRPPVFVWQFGVRPHLRVLEPQRALLRLSTVETCLVSTCISTLTFQAYAFSHAFDKYATNRSDKKRSCLDIPGMARVEKLGGPPEGSKQKVRPHG
jgi:hypothetical protein